MLALELLAPARNKEIGIAAIDCGADAVYIAGPDFGARKAAGNDFDSIRELCDYAHRFGVRIFVTYNTVIEDCEQDKAHAEMLEAQAAGADAFIIRDLRITRWNDITVPLHASTQCAIRTPERAALYAAAGCSRLVLERELSLDRIREIAAAVDCELEFFVHGALCVCYSGECRLSEYVDGRSADKGECIQACRSLYDLVDGDGNVLLRNKAILSLKDYNLKARLGDLAGAGICSFKIEGRLKNISYVRNVVRDYDLALNELVAGHPESYCRASRGRVRGGFTPDSGKTFNRGYTELYIDGRRGKWSSMDAPKSMGEPVGKVGKIRRVGGRGTEISLIPASGDIELCNGDGFAFAHGSGVSGFRGDVCEGRRIYARDVPGLKEGMTLWRNISAAFEKTLETSLCRREIDVDLDVRIHGRYVIELTATTEDGRVLTDSFNADVDTARNRERAEAMLREQLFKRSGIYNFRVGKIRVESPGGDMPLLSASTINSMRRLVADDINALPCRGAHLATGLRVGERQISNEKSDENKLNRLTGGDSRGAELMRSKYCVRYELGLCPVHQGAVPPDRLFLINNGRRFALRFDCAACEMTLTPDGK